MASLTLQLGSLFRSERDRLLRRVRFVVRSSPEAEDIVQDVFVRLLQGPVSRDIAAPASYLNRAATNSALDHLRRQKVLQSVVTAGSDDLTNIAADSPLTEAILQSRQELEILRRAVDNLPPKCRVVFLLAREHGLTMREIAARLAISEGTVEKHLLKAMLRCRAALMSAGREF